MIKILQFLLLVGILLFALNSFSQKKESITKCSASAYSRDDDPELIFAILLKEKFLLLYPVERCLRLSVIAFQITDISYSAEDEAEAVKRGHKVKDGFVHLNGFVGWIYSERTEVNFEGKEK